MYMAAKKMIVTVLAVIAAIVFGNLNQNAYGADEPNAPAEKQKRVRGRTQSEAHGAEWVTGSSSK